MTTLLKELGFIVLACARDLKSAAVLVRAEKPDLVIAGTQFPDGDGLELCRLLLQERGVPILLMTDGGAEDPHLIFEATRAGALEVVPRPPGRNHPDHERLARHLSRTIRTLAGVRIMSRRPDRQVRPVPAPQRSAERAPIPVEELIIAVGASTGGPILLPEILKALAGRPFAFAMVVQHIVPEFIEGFGVWLESQIHVPVRLAANGARPERGTVYMAPPSCQIEVEPRGDFRVVEASRMPTPHTPSIDVAFRSLARFRPTQTTAILLTGMGRDGAEGLLALREAKAFTVAQSPQTAVLASMPEHAIALGAALEILPPPEIHGLLVKQLARTA